MKVTKANLVVCIALMMLGPSMFLLMPMYIGAISDSYGYPASDLGLLASADLIGACIASLIAPLWINKANWRTCTILMWLAFIFGNYLSLSVSDYHSLFILRLVIGLVAGGAMSIAASVISFSTNPARFFAIGVFFQVSYQTISFIVLPDIIGEYLVQGFLFYLIALQLLILPLLYFVPAHLKHSNHLENASLETTVSRANCYKVLAAMGLFFVCQTGVFSFVDLIGNANGLDDQNVGLALSISTFIGLFGAVIAVILADRYGRFKPILFAGLGQLLVLSVFDFTTGLLAYTAMLAIFQLCWNLSLGYQFDTLVKVDISHRFASVVPAAQAAGIALGPILAGNALEIGGSPAIYLVSGIALLLFLVLILPHTRTTRPILAQSTDVANNEVAVTKTTSLQN